MAAQAIPIEQLYISSTEHSSDHPILNRRYILPFIDAFEYCLGLRRGDLDGLMETSQCQVSLRDDLIRHFEKNKWALVPKDYSPKDIHTFFKQNQAQGNIGRVRYDEFIPLKPTYMYQIFIAEGLIIFGPNGEPCVSGETLVEASVHPCFTVYATLCTFAHGIGGRPEGKPVHLMSYHWIYALLRRAIPWTWWIDNGDLVRPYEQTVFDDRDELRKVKEGSLIHIIRGERKVHS